MLNQNILWTISHLRNENWQRRASTQKKNASRKEPGLNLRKEKLKAPPHRCIHFLSECAFLIANVRPLCIGKMIHTSLSQLKLVNWSFPQVNIPIDRGHWLPEIASVCVWVLESWAPLGCLCHFIRVITSRVVPAWVLSVSCAGASPLPSQFLHQACGFCFGNLALNSQC